MRRIAFLLSLALALALTAGAASADHHDEHRTDVVAAADTNDGQSIAPSADVSADSDTCGGDGKCCGACQFKKKHAKNQGEEGGCPCQRAKRARQRALQEKDQNQP